MIPYRAGVILADFFYSLPCLHVSKDWNIAWEGGEWGYYGLSREGGVNTKKGFKSLT